MTGGAADVWDAVVLGAGPAGSFASRLLAQRGLSVLLVDRHAMPRPKPCGGCLNAAALATLRGAGLGGMVDALRPAPLREFVVVAGGRSARWALAGGGVVDRAAFDHALVDVAQAAGARFVAGVEARVAGVDGSGRAVSLRGPDGERTVRGRVVIAATGAHGVPSDAPGLRRRIDPGALVGLQAELCGDAAASAAVDEGTLVMAVAEGGYVGAVRRAGRVTLAAAVDRGHLRQAGGPEPLVRRILTEAGAPMAADLAGAEWRGTPSLRGYTPRVADVRLFVAGDAARYVEPFTGEGIAWALQAAQQLAPIAAAAAARWHPALATQWTHASRRLAGAQRTCRLLSGWLRRAAGRRAGMAIVTRWPRLAAPLLRRAHAV